MPRLSEVLIKKYCGDDENELIRYTLHAYSQPYKGTSLRNSLYLDTTEIGIIKEKGMFGIREELVAYFDNLDNGGKFSITNALYATGVCCRNCMSVCHRIRYWESLATEQKNKFVGMVMKWIQKMNLSDEDCNDS